MFNRNCLAILTLLLVGVVPAAVGNATSARPTDAAVEILRESGLGTSAKDLLALPQIWSGEDSELLAFQKVKLGETASFGRVQEITIQHDPVSTDIRAPDLRAGIQKWARENKDLRERKATNPSITVPVHSNLKAHVSVGNQISGTRGVHEALIGLRNADHRKISLQSAAAQPPVEPAPVTGKDIVRLLAQLQKDLNSANSADRKRAALAFGTIAGLFSQIVMSLEVALSDPDDDVRILSARALGDLGPYSRGAASALTQLVHQHKNQTVRAEAAKAIAHVFGGSRFERRSATLIPLLEQAALQDEDPEVRKWSIWALAAVAADSPAAVPTLIAIVKNKENTHLRENAIAALAGAGPSAKGAIPILLEILRARAESVSMKRLVCDILGRIGASENEVVPALMAILGDAEQLDLYTAALVGIDGYGPKGKAALATVIKILEATKGQTAEQETNRRIAAVRALAAIAVDDVTVRKILETIASDPKDAAQAHAARILSVNAQ